MKVLFAHDHVFYEKDGEFYSNGGLSQSVLQRYTGVFSEMSIISRQRGIDFSPARELTLASTAGVRFVAVPDFHSVSRTVHLHRAHAIIEAEVKAADCLIARVPSLIAAIAVHYARKHSRPYLMEVVGCAWDALWNSGSLPGRLLAPYSYLQNR